MKLLDLKQVVRKDSPIHYINEYHAVLLYQVSGVQKEEKLEIIIEKTAFGTADFRVNTAPGYLDDHSKTLELFIKEKYKEGLFPE